MVMFLPSGILVPWFLGSLVFGLRFLGFSVSDADSDSVRVMST